MKDYENYMNTITAPQGVYEKTMTKLARKQQPNHRHTILKFTAAAAFAVVILLAGVLGHSLRDDSGITSGEPHSPLYYPLIFNKVPSLPTSELRIAAFSSFVVELTQEQLASIFYGVDAVDGMALHWEDGAGTLQHTMARFAPNEHLVKSIIIYPSINDSPQILTPDPDEHIISYVHGIPVRAIIFNYPHSGINSINVDFELEGQSYHVSGWIPSAGGEVAIAAAKAQITELVNTLILNGPPDLSILANPEVPEMHYEEMDINTARQDPYFGAFLPVTIPDDFTGAAHRMVNWMGEVLFLDLHNMGEFISWNIRERSIHDITHPYHPLFTAEEITLDDIKSTERLSEGFRSIPPMITLGFGVLYDDIIVIINTRGVTPQQIWGMLP